jgi:hypothetical protein
MSWIVPSRFLAGRGSYFVTVRVRDGYGRVSAPAAFSMRLDP